MCAYCHSLWNAFGGYSRLYGIETVLKLEQSPNTHSPIEVTEFGIVTDSNLLQRWNAHSPMLFTKFGITTNFKLPHDKMHT